MQKKCNFWKLKNVFPLSLILLGLMIRVKAIGFSIPMLANVTAVWDVDILPHLTENVFKYSCLQS